MRRACQHFPSDTASLDQAAHFQLCLLPLRLAQCWRCDRARNKDATTCASTTPVPLITHSGGGTCHHHLERQRRHWRIMQSQRSCWCWAHPWKHVLWDLDLQLFRQDQVSNALHFAFPEMVDAVSITIADGLKLLIEALRRDLGTQVVSDAGDAAPPWIETEEVAYAQLPKLYNLLVPTIGDILHLAAIGTSVSGKRHQQQETSTRQRGSASPYQKVGGRSQCLLAGQSEYQCQCQRIWSDARGCSTALC